LQLVPIVVGRARQRVHVVETGERQVTKGRELVGRIQRSANSERQWCTKCGGHLMTHHPVWGITDVYAATIPSLAFEAAVHVNYAETVLRMKDGLPKLKDFPRELGGSGEAVPE
jgi:hypothetical protein